MIEIYVPFLLVLMSWYPDDPQGTMQIKHRLLIDEATCLAAGEETAALVKAEEDDGAARKFAWRCVKYEMPIEVYQPLMPAR